MRAMCGVSIMDRVWNEDACRRCGSEVKYWEKNMYINVLRWYDNGEKIEERMVKSLYREKVEGSRASGWQKVRWAV
jgi:hypothetical protein